MEEDLDDYLGKLANDIAQEKLKLLMEDGFSISPKSGRIRKRTRVKEVRPIISKRRAKKYTQKIMWTVIIILFALCMIVLFPQIETKKKENAKYGTTK